MKWMQVKNLLEYFEHHSLDDFKDFIDHIDSQNDERNINEDNYSPHQLALIKFMELFSQFETALADDGMMGTFFNYTSTIEDKQIPQEYKNKRLYVVFKDGLQNLKSDIELFFKAVTNSNEEQKVHPKLQNVINNISQTIKMVDTIIAFELSRYNSYFIFNEEDKGKAESWIKQMKSFYQQLQTASPEDYGLSVESTRYLQNIISRISATDNLLQIKPNNKIRINFDTINRYQLTNNLIDILPINLCNNYPTIGTQYRSLREQIKKLLAAFNFLDIADDADKGDFSRVLPVESEMTRDQTEIFREIEQLLLDMAELFDLQ